VRVPLVDRVPPVLLRAQQVATSSLLPLLANASAASLLQLSDRVLRERVCGALLRQKRAAVGKQLAVPQPRSRSGRACAT
jgi:hypothetical protein